MLVYIGDLTPLFTMVVSALRNGGKIAFTVEKLEHGDFKLLETGRYAHSLEYIQRICTQHALEVLIQDNIVLREQKGAPIHGLLLVVSYVTC